MKMSTEALAEIRLIIRDNGSKGVSKNAICQALKRTAQEHRLRLTKEMLLSDLLQVGMTRIGSARYWEEVYNIRPWNDRSAAERDAASSAAASILRVAGII